MTGEFPQRPGSGDATYRRYDLGRGLDACHDSVARDGVVTTRGGTAIATSERIAGVGGLVGNTVDCGYTSSLLRQHGLSVAALRSSPANWQGLDLAYFECELVRLQTKVLRTVLDAAVRRLDDRTSEGNSLLSRQMVQGHIAEVAVVLVESEVVLDDLVDRDLPWRVHRRLVTAGRRLLPLFGAASFLVDGAGLDVHLIELIGNTYLQPSAEGT